MRDRRRKWTGHDLVSHLCCGLLQGDHIELGLEHLQLPGLLLLLDDHSVQDLVLPIVEGPVQGGVFHIVTGET